MIILLSSVKVTFSLFGGICGLGGSYVIVDK